MSKKYSALVLVISTKGSRGEREDLVGPVVGRRLQEAGYELEPTLIITDDRAVIAETLVELVDQRRIDLVLTSGGTGLSPSDVTPEATEEVLERQIPGLPEAMRATGRAITPHADLSRALAGQRGRSLIINLPGSPKGALENLEIALPALGHALDKIKGDERDCAR